MPSSCREQAQTSDLTSTLITYHDKTHCTERQNPEGCLHVPAASKSVQVQGLDCCVGPCCIGRVVGTMCKGLEACG